MDWRHTSAKL